jgi:CheY-like chemotaxis protein
MTTPLALSFAAVSHGRAPTVIRFLAGVDALAAGAVAGADLGLRREGQYLVVRLALDARFASEQIVQRLRFWCARAGGHAALAEDDLGAECDRRLAEAEVVRRGVPAPRLGLALVQMLAEAGAPELAPVEDGALPALHLQVCGPGWSGVAYDRVTRTVFVPTALAPPPGDELTLQLETPPPARGIARAQARVLDPKERDPFAPAGFFAKLVGECGSVDRVLSATSPRVPPFSTRRAAQRYAVSGPVAVGGAAAGGSLVDISQGGAFIRTGRRAGVGADVDVEVRLPNDTTVQAKAKVVHERPDGMGVEFRLDGGAREALASAVTSLAGRRPHVLVVDDDALTRRMLADAFDARGWEVLTAADARSAMQTLADQLFTLDLLATDVLMPGMDGEVLVRSIRRIGGEGDLPILVMSGSVDGALEERLRLAGADAVVAKSAGAPAIVARAEGVVAERRGGAPADAAAS